MKTTEHGIESSKDVENIYHMRLMALLQELVREKGYKGAARVLEIDPQTVTEAAKSGQLTRRVRQALERALQEGVGSAAERQRRRNTELEGRIETLEKGHEELGKEAAQASGRRRGRGGIAQAGRNPGDRGRSRRRRSLPVGRMSGRSGVAGEASSGQKASVEAVDAAGVPRPGDAGGCR